MLAITLYFALSRADRMAKAWNESQAKHACTVDIEVVDLHDDDDDDGGKNDNDDKNDSSTEFPSLRTEVCQSRKNRMPHEVPEGYYLQFQIPEGWVLKKAKGGNEVKKAKAGDDD